MIPNHNHKPILIDVVRTHNASMTTAIATLFLAMSLCFLIGGSVAFSTDPLSSPDSETTPTHTRRQWLGKTVAGTVTIATTTNALVASPQAALAEPSFFSDLQGPVQDTIAPGHWIGQFLGLNSRTESWDFPNSSPEEVSKALVDVLESLSDDRKEKLYMPEFQIQSSDSSRVHVLTWTKLEWLDTLDVRFSSVIDGKSNDGTKHCIARASFYATGFLPTSIPLAPLFNIAAFWFPFASPGPRGEMLQEFRLRAIKSLVSKKLEENRLTPDLFV